MHSNKFNKAILAFFRATALSLIFCLVATGAMAQSKIVQILYGGQKKSQATITYIAPKLQPQTRPVQLSQQFSAGTVFIIPASTQVTLKSGGSENYQVLPPGSKHEVTIGPKGESHRTFWGHVTHIVKNRINFFYKASGPNKMVRAASSGTVFTVKADGKGVKFETTEGRVTILQKVPVKIGEASKSLKKHRNRELTVTKSSNWTAGMSTKAYYDDPQEEEYFDTYDEALKAFENQISRGAQDVADLEQLADDYTLLGELYLDDGQPQQAVQPLRKALDIYDQFDLDDSFLAEVYLNLAEALIDSGNRQEGLHYSNLAIDLVNETLAYDVEDYQFADRAKDYDLVWSIGNDLVDGYENLGWAYDLKDDTAKADQYYQWADQLSQYLDKL